MATETRIWPDVAIPPGEVLGETLEARGMSQAELARRMGRPIQAVNEIVQGTKAITAETALQLEKVLGTPAHVWTRLESDYRFLKAKLADKERLKSEVPQVKRYPYATMVRLGWVVGARDAVTRVERLLGFFGVASLRQVPDAQEAAFRRSARIKASPEALAAWLREGERRAQHIETRPFDERALRDNLRELRAMTLQRPEEFEPRLRNLLAGHGVALVFVPHLPKTGAHGSTRWIGDKAVVQMSLRYKWEDIFWFTLFHELGHVLLHPRRDVFVERDDDGKSEEERQANAFAAEQLIPPSAYQLFVASRRAAHISEAAVVAFSREQEIAPSIMVGRLQHDGVIPHSHLNGLRRQFERAKNHDSE